MNIEKDLKDLKIDGRLTEKYRSLEGTRHIIQYENPKYVFTLSKTYKPDLECFGITNRCEDGKYILFMEYDKIYKKLMYKNLFNLMRKFPKDLDIFYIAETESQEKIQTGEIKGSYHVVNFIKQQKYKIKRMLRYTDCDSFFLEIPEKTAHKTHVLRISEKFYKINGKVHKEKPRFIETFPKISELNKSKCSFPHYQFFNLNWNIPRRLAHNFDNLSNIEVHKYLTPKKVD